MLTSSFSSWHLVSASHSFSRSWKVVVVICYCLRLFSGVACAKVEIPNSSNLMKCENNCVVSLITGGGKVCGNCSHANYNAFTRIPYALPPVGELRFESPQPFVQKWSNIKAANRTVAVCVQYFKNGSPLSGSEDCLYVNVYVPKKKNSTKLPVIVWIHPGAFQFGSADNNPGLLMLFGGIIYVTISYRVGPTGFLSTGDTRIPGNFGLKDQRLAIKWVHENIAAFGGDPDKVLLLGCSAGGASVEYHMITNKSRAKAFASLSGTIFNPWAFTSKPEEPAKKFGQLLNCNFNATGNQFKNCLKSKPIKQLWQATMDMHEYFIFNNALFRPTIESSNVKDAILTKNPLIEIKEGKNKNKRFLVGLVPGEGAYLAASFLMFNKKNIEVIEELNKRWNEVCPLIFFLHERPKIKIEQKCAELKRNYMCNRTFNINSYKLLERMFDDEYFYKGIEMSVELHQKAGQKVYRYIANLPSRYNVGNVLSQRLKDLCFESVHTSDIFTLTPLNFGFPKQKLSNNQLETLRSFVNLFKSLLDDDRPPMYKDKELPLNNGKNVSQCLHFSYDEYKVNKCDFAPIDCKNVKSIKCTK